MVYGARDNGPRQRFVEVDVRHTLDGMLIPLRINWSDGRVFEIAEYHYDGMDHGAQRPPLGRQDQGPQILHPAVASKQRPLLRDGEGEAPGHHGFLKTINQETRMVAYCASLPL